MTDFAFAVPGSLEARTGGTLYDKHVITAAREAGHGVTHVALPGAWPDPTARDVTAAFAALDDLPSGMPVLVDGLAFGVLPAAELGRMTRPLIALVHHPLALEPGLAPDTAARLERSERAALAQAAQVVVPSRHIGKLVGDLFGVDPGRIHVAHPGFDRPATVAPAPQTPPLILSVGLICHRKGHDVLVRALAQLADLDWQAAIVGKVQDAAYFEHLKTLARDAGLGSRLLFPGELSAQALQTYYARASVFALATRYEGYGMVLSEAQLQGLPVISCETGAVPEALDGSGLLAPPDDPAAFAGHLRAVLSDSALRARLVAQTRARAAKLPRWADTAAIMAGAVTAVSSSPG